MYLFCWLFGYCIAHEFGIILDYLLQFGLDYNWWLAFLIVWDMGYGIETYVVPYCVRYSIGVYFLRFKVGNYAILVCIYLMLLEAFIVWNLGYYLKSP